LFFRHSQTPLQLRDMNTSCTSERRAGNSNLYATSPLLSSTWNGPLYQGNNFPLTFELAKTSNWRDFQIDIVTNLKFQFSASSVCVTLLSRLCCPQVIPDNLDLLLCISKDF
jgi:hypothetical protein